MDLSALGSVTLKPAGNEEAVPKMTNIQWDEEGIKSYHATVLDINIERWIGDLEEHTFATAVDAVSVEEAKLMMDVYERDRSGEALSSAQEEGMASLKERLQAVMDSVPGEGGFVKMSSRSPKDVALTVERLRPRYQDFLAKFVEEEGQETDNVKMRAFLQTHADALHSEDASAAMELLRKSERVFDDLTLATKYEERYENNMVVRQWIDIPVEMEFRAFVKDGKLTGVCQYCKFVCSPPLLAAKDALAARLRTFFDDTIQSKLAGKFTDYIIDFAVVNLGTSAEKVWVIELNPFLETTDSILFSWKHDYGILSGHLEFEFRVVPKPLKSARVLLPDYLRDLFDALTL